MSATLLPRPSTEVWHTASEHGCITLEVVATTSGLDSLRSEWRRLADEMEVPSPFLSWEWSRIWWQTFGGRRQLCVVVLREHDNVVGIAPFYRRWIGPVRAVVPFGWPDRLTEHIEPLIPGRDRPRAFAALNDWLSRHHTAGLVCGIDNLAAAGFGDRAIRDEVFFDWRELPSDWEVLTNGLHRSMRGNIRYYPRLLERHGHRLGFRIASDVESVKAALPTLFALHTARSKATTGERHLDRLRDPVRRRFMERLAEVLPARGEMKIGIVEVDGVDVAAQLWFEHAGTIFLHYSGYAPEWSRYSVAMIATSEIIRLGVERGMKRVEFLRGSKQFKTRWNTSQRVVVDAYFVRQPWLLPVFHRLRSIRRTLRVRAYRRAVSQPSVAEEPATAE